MARLYKLINLVSCPDEQECIWYDLLRNVTAREMSFCSENVVTAHKTKPQVWQCIPASPYAARLRCPKATIGTPGIARQAVLVWPDSGGVDDDAGVMVRHATHMQQTVHISITYR